MCKRSFALLLLSVCAWTQSLPIDDPSDPVVAVVNGRKITKSEYQKMIEAQDASMQALAQQQPKAFLENMPIRIRTSGRRKSRLSTSKALSKKKSPWPGGKSWSPG